MAINVPSEPKINTTKYDSFKGVDFTNDPTNVWYRRSPTGVNMIPDSAGKPHKRTGWEIAISKEDIAGLYANDNDCEPPSELSITRCHYFELNGEDHIFIFTNIGVFIYRNGELVSSKSVYPISDISYDETLIDSFERAFFFEGGGQSAFYIYGGFKVWKYEYADGYVWSEAEPYIPKVRISVDARHEAGTMYETVNMLSDFIAEDFQNNVYPAVSSATTTVSGGSVTVDESAFVAVESAAKSYVFTYDGANSVWTLGGDRVTLSNYGIKLTGTPANGNKITVVVTNARRINLGRLIGSTDGLKVYASVNTQFDTEITVQNVETHQTARYCTLITSGTQSYLKFYADYLPLVTGEDAVRVIYPRNAVQKTARSYSFNVTAEAN